MVESNIQSFISVPCGEVNAVYYAGSIDDKSILMHETSTGMHKWILSEANIERDIIMPYTADKSKWLLLKGTTNQCFRHWNWKKEIEAKIQNLTKNSALVKPLSTFYRVDGNLNGSNAWVVRVDEFLVKATLCDILKNGDKICTEQLYDGSNEEKQSIISKARLNMNPIVGRKPRDGGLCLASWDCGKFIQPEELPTETFFGSSSECENAISCPLFMTGCKEMKTGCKHANDRPFGPLGGPGAVFTCSHPCTSPVWRVSRDRAA